MRALLLAPLLAAAPAFAAPVPAGPSQYHCTGTGEGADGERADVTLYFDAQGRGEGRSATWDPPRTADPAAVANPPDLSLTLFYSEPGPGSPGASSGASVTAMAFAAPGTRGAGKLDSRLEGARAELSANGAAPTVLAMERDPRIADLPMTAMRFAALEPLPQATRQLSVRLLDRRGKLLAAARFDLSGTARRDTLYREAWSKAEAEGADPAKCPAATE